MADIFLSYAREHEVFVEQLAGVLAGLGWSVWWDRHIPAGRLFDAAIAEQLAQTRCVIVLWSNASLASPWVIEEAADARDRSILVPVFLESVRPPFGFRHVHAASLIGWNGDTSHEGYRSLIADLTELLGGPRGAPGPRDPDASTRVGRQSAGATRERVAAGVIDRLGSRMGRSGLVPIALVLFSTVACYRWLNPGGSLALVWIVIFFCACESIGQWLEAEADREWKNMVRDYLRSGMWADRVGDLASVSARAFSKIYGNRYVSRQVLKRIIQLSAIPLLGGILLFWALGRPVWMMLTWETVAFALIPRLLLTMVSDFLNITKTRYLIRHLQSAKSVIARSGLLLLLDFLIATILSIAVTVAAMNIFSILYTSQLRQRFTWAWQTDVFDYHDRTTRHFIREYIGGLINLNDVDGLFLYISYLPFLLLCIYIVGLVFSKILSKVANWLRLPLTRLQYQQPFLFVFRVTATAVAAMLVVGWGV
jgi:hypothetical protein